MVSLPRIMTVDPTGNIPAQIRAAFELMDRLVVQIDVPGPTEALEELQRGGIDAVIAAWNLGDGTQGWELAAKLRQVDDNVSIMLLGDYKDTDLDDEMREQSPFVYLKRPFDIPQLINVLKAAIDGGDIFAAVNAPTTSSGTKVDLGPVPAINADKVDEVMQGVMYDLNPIAAMVTTRDGAVVTGRTELGDADYEHMARLVGTSAEMNINMRDVIGGNLQTLQLYDGSDFDIFVLSVGLHHFLVLVFDGKDGASQIGAVRRYGSKHAENLIAIMGPAAFLVQRREVQDEPEQVVRRSDRSAKYSTQEVQQPELARADLGNSNGATTQEEDAPVIQSAMPQLDAIADDDFDLDSLFGGDLDDASADDLFSLDALESLDLNEKKKGTASMEDAINLGILDGDM